MSNKNTIDAFSASNGYTEHQILIGEPQMDALIALEEAYDAYITGDNESKLFIKLQYAIEEYNIYHDESFF